MTSMTIEETGTHICCPFDEVDKHGHMGIAAVDLLHQELQLKKENVISVIFEDVGAIH